SLLGAAPRQPANFARVSSTPRFYSGFGFQPSFGLRISDFGFLHRGRGRQVMHLPCKQAHAGALPADSTIFNCGENEIQASLISSASVGATPTPATSLNPKTESPKAERIPKAEAR